MVVDFYFAITGTLFGAIHNSAIQPGNKGRQANWTQSIAVGDESFIEKVKEALGFRARGRKIRRADDAFELRETLNAYGATASLVPDNTVFMEPITIRLLNQSFLALKRGD